MSKKRAFVALTGASGAIYGIAIMHALISLEIEVYASATANAIKNAETELGRSFADFKELIEYSKLQEVNYFAADDTGAAPASGSFKIDYYIAAPASMGFVGRLASGISSNLPERAFDVAIKERRPAVILFREMPLSSIHLENMLKLTNAGAIIMPAAPGFYHKPKTVSDIIDFVVGKVLDILNIENDLFERWNG